MPPTAVSGHSLKVVWQLPFPTALSQGSFFCKAALNAFSFALLM